MAALATFPIAVSPGGCGSAPQADFSEEGPSHEAEEVGTAEQGLTNGTAVGEDVAAREGILQIRTFASRVDPYGCTAVLVRNDMVLTARHCVTEDGTVEGQQVPLTNLQLALVGESTGIAGVASITRLLTSDAVLIRTRSLFPMNATRYGFRRSMGLSTDAFLVGKWVNCYGYGDTANVPRGQLRTARLKVTSSTSTTITVSRNSQNQALTYGDSGGPCYADDGTLVGLVSGGTSSKATLVGPQVLRIVKGMTESQVAATAVASNANTSANFFRLDSRFLTGVSDVVYTVTPNFNPPGSIGIYNSHHTGVWHTGSEWSVFNQDGASMPLGAAFNVTMDTTEFLGGRGRVHIATVSNIVGHLTRLDIAGLNGNSSAKFIVTPNWQPSSVYNNHAVGVYFNGGAWYIFNEDFASMPAGAAFNIELAGPEEIAFVQKVTPASVSGHMTYLGGVLFDNQPDARFFVTHNWTEGGGLYNPSPIGVWFDGARQKWAIFNQDFAAMPLTAFNILVRP